LTTFLNFPEISSLYRPGEKVGPSEKSHKRNANFATSPPSIEM